MLTALTTSLLALLFLDVKPEERKLKKNKNVEWHVNYFTIVILIFSYLKSDLSLILFLLPRYTYVDGPRLGCLLWDTTCKRKTRTKWILCCNIFTTIATALSLISRLGDGKCLCLLINGGICLL